VKRPLAAIKAFLGLLIALFVPWPREGDDE
jgi:hypothetical protein